MYSVPQRADLIAHVFQLLTYELRRFIVALSVLEGIRAGCAPGRRSGPARIVSRCRRIASRMVIKLFSRTSGSICVICS